MQWIDEVAAFAAQKWAGNVVTVSVDNIQFKKPIPMGSRVTLKAAVNRAWESSMEVGVKVFYQKMNENRLDEEIAACKAYLTFVAIDEQGKPRVMTDKQFTPAPGEEWQRRYKQADERRARRLSGT